MRKREYVGTIFVISLILLMVCGLGIKVDAQRRSLGLWTNHGHVAEQLTALNQKLTNAYLQEDIDLLRQMLDDDHVHNNVFGVALTKDQFLGDIESGILQFESYATPEIRWHIDGGTAVATGTIRAQAKRADKVVPASEFLFTRVFVKRGEQWKVLLFHNTMMPKQSDSASDKR